MFVIIIIVILQGDGAVQRAAAPVVEGRQVRLGVITIIITLIINNYTQGGQKFAPYSVMAEIPPSPLRILTGRLSPDV